MDRPDPWTPGERIGPTNSTRATPSNSPNSTATSPLGCGTSRLSAAAGPTVTLAVVGIEADEHRNLVGAVEADHFADTSVRDADRSRGASFGGTPANGWFPWNGFTYGSPSAVAGAGFEPATSGL
jgi:hypothetical protein